jgi:peptidoglycan/LPS O-acetylase OafA/YrhL
MTEQTPNLVPEPLDRREARRQRRAERLADPSRGSAWIVGLILIVLGTMFLMNNMGTFNIPIKNWWALFILIPAVGSFDTALRAYRNAGDRLDRVARSSLLVGLVLTFVTVMFLFDLSWGFFGPVLLILAGIGLVLSYMIE